MNMHNPPHPGEFIKSIYMETHGISCRAQATHLGVAASTLNRVVKGKSAVTPEMALRLSKVLGRSPESWLSMQGNYELWQAKQNINLDNVQPIDLHAA
ncbi:HigA family addiction module antitoxin [Marinomonas aquiplantarum]|uniref:XRE family plasmid maintenance system antidote protein n=1 Tax=Marinomonas aquiplantarum TaxID=491951 RepID=A0A366CY03_9GAMM|nr:HigA family addiction module antitoxin [Marinomonas aquiplantarum]RBO81868.1 XRE family plasmid maintenance system antidote protein [Marinomonas aquiplantarum]